MRQRTKKKKVKDERGKKGKKVSHTSIISIHPSYWLLPFTDVIPLLPVRHGLRYVTLRRFMVVTPL